MFRRVCGQLKKIGIEFFRISRAPLIDGDSGSLVLKADQSVIEVFNSTNVEGEQGTLNNPVEIWGREFKVKQSFSYGSLISDLYGCIDEK
ncbi:MAG: hypothetical protein AB7N80_02460 [Bdellovibrionales bacterium]